MTASPRPSRGAVLRRRGALLAAVVAAGLTLAACGGDDDMAGMDHGGTQSSAAGPASPDAAAGSGSGANPAPGAFNDTDVMFAQMMIPHHEQALEMSALADGRAEDTEITALAREISGAQDPEIQKMTSWLRAWGKPGTAPMDHGSGHGSESGGMARMMSAKDLAGLKAAQGRAFDRAFAQLMIDHHKGAVEMAEDERKNGRNATARQLAEDVITTQSAEIARLEKILARL
ncbi:DUF305 domain-containing protein [Streptomyces clavuligerus]|uniref:Lipoprotein n=1 Tax=Streptomyces clavuligerus TaxID=1901 RepID=E2Q868_STRCL|nr:DUF305 domain-containing protein [Streptomyces clavuligerus]ANW21445.1 DUF305 domain-containing protein [Streptomyces clavuligerus]AXU16078.1 DUF305 domain-containing protein [Streptomyces clavuligerus]EFG05400.1 lipoprotein [Streptomyces clavuligerus]MBY6306215.1 DUF305 domain-containing protein [Streptomyces clavuligerus]QCS08856.1 DUF305 domain-containing protein [Streptomyces clavuligerus]